MGKAHDTITDKTTEENAAVTISSACYLKDGGTPQNAQGIFRNISKLVLILSLLSTYFHE